MQYQPNPKHKAGHAPGRRGSLCPPDANAASLLAASAPDGKKRYATDGERAFCGQCPDQVRDLWHGYPIDWDEVPPKILKVWFDGGVVSPRTVRRARRLRR